MKKTFLLLVVLFTAFSAFSAEFIDGRIKLVLNPNTGRFSLYYMNDLAREEFTPLFTDQDPRTSFLSLMINNRTYKMGETSLFKTTLGGTPSSPSLIFESSFAVVVQNFSFIKTGSSPMTNGVLITITVTNKSEQTINAGLRLLIDTDLGEKNSAHFYINQSQINNETLIERTSSENYWVSKNSKVALMGSILGENRPDSIHFANWKRLNDAPWKINHMPGRNFNLLPYSIGDSAVCYYYESAPLPKGSTRTASLTLFSTLETERVIEYETVIVKAEETETEPPAISVEISNTDADLADSIRVDLHTLSDLVLRLDETINSHVYISDEELAAISLLISRIKLKYSIP